MPNTFQLRPKNYSESPAPSILSAALLAPTLEPQITLLPRITLLPQMTEDPQMEEGSGWSTTLPNWSWVATGDMAVPCAKSVLASADVMFK